MKQTEFNSLTNVATPAAALLLSTGDKFLFNETQIFQDGTMPNARNGGKNNSSQKVTALRHKIMYYERDTSTIGYHPCFDILESDIGAQQSKTITRKGKTRVATRDDDGARDIIASPDFS